MSCPAFAFRYRGFQLPMQGCSLFVVQVVAATGQHLIEGNQLDHLALGQLGRLVQHETPLVNVSLERLAAVIFLGLSLASGCVAA